MLRRLRTAATPKSAQSQEVCGINKMPIPMTTKAVRIPQIDRLSDTSLLSHGRILERQLRPVQRTRL
jgi:hypothetical protein